MQSIMGQLLGAQNRVERGGQADRGMGLSEYWLKKLRGASYLS